MKENKQITALKESIKHWEENYEAESVDNISVRWDSCACCVLWIENECEECPISEFTGQQHCHGTPYQDYDFDYFECIYTPELREAWFKDNRKYFPEEIEFLQNVLKWVEDGKPEKGSMK